MSDGDVSCTAPATGNASLQILFKCPTPAIVFENATKPARISQFCTGAEPIAPTTRNGAWTSNSGPNVVCLWHVHFDLCFAPQRRAFFVHLSCQNCSGPKAFCTRWLGNMLRARTACTFWTSKLPKAVRHWSAFSIFTSHVHFLYISAAKTAPDLKRFVHADLEICFAPERRALFEHLNSQKRSDTEVLLAFSLRTCIFCTSQLPKLLRSWSVLYILTWNCASCHNGLHIFNISTSKSAPGLKHFVHFHLKMWFAPQHCALFQHLNLQKCSEPRCDFHMLTSKCASRQSRAHFLHISTSKSALNPDVFGLLASKSASLQFSISHHPRWLRTRRSSEPTFRRSGATKYWKNTVFRACLPFRTFWSVLWSSFSWLFLFWLFLLPSSSHHRCYISWKFDFQTSFNVYQSLGILFVCSWMLSAAHAGHFAVKAQGRRCCK